MSAGLGHVLLTAGRQSALDLDAIAGSQFTLTKLADLSHATN